jgi:hypothetical protein
VAKRHEAHRGFFAGTRVAREAEAVLLAAPARQAAERCERAIASLRRQ